jgi:hypothetical protein
VDLGIRHTETSRHGAKLVCGFRQRKQTLDVGNVNQSAANGRFDCIALLRSQRDDLPPGTRATVPRIACSMMVCSPETS